MGYRGYEIRLCAQGHMAQDSVGQFVQDEGWACDVCGSPLALRVGVDETNMEDGVHVPVFELAEPEKVDTCESCGHDEVTEPTRYIIPEKEDVVREWIRFCFGCNAGTVHLTEPEDDEMADQVRCLACNRVWRR